jgi:putative transposase
MRKARFTDEETVALLGEADSEPTGVVAKRHKVSEQTIHNGRKKFGALSTDEVPRLQDLEADKTLLKNLVVDRDLEIEVMKEIAAKKNGECAGPPRRCDVCD